MSRLDPGNRMIVLDERGKKFTSTGLAKKLDGWLIEGKNLDFVIGGAQGLHQSLKDEAEEMISLSLLTMPHQMARLFLIEALYRASSILSNHPYHRS